MTVDAISMLQKDHRAVEELLSYLETARSEKQRATLLGKLQTELEAHAGAEEKVLYPYAERFSETETLVERSYEEHDEALRVLDELMALEGNAEEWNARLGELRRTLDHHIAEEEEMLFPRLRQISTLKQLADLGAELRSARSWTLKKAG